MNNELQQHSSIPVHEVDALQFIVEGTIRNVGEHFFQSLVLNLCRAMNVQNAFVAEFAGSNSRVRTIAFCKHETIVENEEWDLAGTPCEDVVRGELCHHPSHVFDRFPNDLALKTIDSYLGVAMRDSSGHVLGHLAVFDEKPLPAELKLLNTFQIFAARAAAEVERLRQEKLLRESNERFRDLFDEAPIAYVLEDLESRFIKANHKAMDVLGIRPDEVVGTIGKSFIPDTPEAMGYFEEAFASIGRGMDTSGITMELRRKNDGRPIWIQWWSRPDPSGDFTRTMFIDVTDKVLLAREQVRLKAQNSYLREEINSVHNYEEIIGKSTALLAALEKVSRVAAKSSRPMFA